MVITHAYSCFVVIEVVSKSHFLRLMEQSNLKGTHCDACKGDCVNSCPINASDLAAGQPELSSLEFLIVNFYSVIRHFMAANTRILGDAVGNVNLAFFRNVDRNSLCLEVLFLKTDSFKQTRAGGILFIGEFSGLLNLKRQLGG